MRAAEQGPKQELIQVFQREIHYNFRLLYFGYKSIFPPSFSTS